jgi:hypothetical protein
MSEAETLAEILVEIRKTNDLLESLIERIERLL